jgi:dipeptidyl-peptidase-3
MPWDPAYRREGVRGVSGKAVEVVVETGHAGPVTPVGINLPNDQLVRERYGSKSVSLANVAEAYEKATPRGFRREFSWTTEEADRAEKWAAIAGELLTSMHEVIGHGSGRIEAALNGNPQAFLREHYSALEETRADLVGLYFLPDPKVVELGLVPAADHQEVVLAAYEAYARNALVQLRRVREGTQIEEDHMRNRQTVVRWLMANSTAIEVRWRDGKTFYVMTDATAFREGVGRLLAEVQRVKATGDYAAAASLIDAYGVHFDAALRDEVVARVEALDLPSYTGFVMPRLEPVQNEAGETVDIAISYPMDFAAQMLEYSGKRA